jgi:hypothetical protein
MVEIILIPPHPSPALTMAKTMQIGGGESTHPSRNTAPNRKTSPKRAYFNIHIVTKSVMVTGKTVHKHGLVRRFSSALIGFYREN